jgi:threonine dehydratase
MGATTFALAAPRVDDVVTVTESESATAIAVLARRCGALGFTLNDAVLALQGCAGVDSTVVRAEIQRLLHDGLLDVGNDERGRVVYREP